MDVRDDVLYLLRVDEDSFIIEGYRLKDLFRIIEDNKLIVVKDIANNYMEKPYTQLNKISYQELYHIELIKLK